jgi:hypothetical protein
MTNAQAATAVTIDRDRDRDRVRSAVVPTGIVTTIVTLAFTAWGVFWHAPGVEADGPREFYLVAPVVLVIAVAVYGVVLPRALRKDNAGATALTLSIVAAVAIVPAHWAGLPLVLGVAGAMLGYAGKRARSGVGTSIAAFVIGILASLGYVAFYVGDTLVQTGIF